MPVKTVQKFFGMGFWQGVVSGIISGLLMSSVVIGYIKYDFPKLLEEAQDKARSMSHKLTR